MTTSIVQNKVLSELSAEQVAELENIRRQIAAMLPTDIRKSAGQIEQHLGRICQIAEQNGDLDTYNLACETWQEVQAMAATGEMAEGLAAGNALATQVVVEQRDDLLRAIDREDEEHPEVAALIAGVREDTEYQVVTREQDAARNEALEITVSNLERHYYLSHETAVRLAADIVKGFAGLGDSMITNEHRAAIGDAITAILEDWRQS